MLVYENRHMLVYILDRTVVKQVSYLTILAITLSIVHKTNGISINSNSLSGISGMLKGYQVCENAIRFDCTACLPLRVLFLITDQQLHQQERPCHHVALGSGASTGMFKPALIKTLQSNMQ